MVLETVKATYDRDTKKVYVKLSDSEIVQRQISHDGEVHYYVDMDHEIVGIEVILS